MTKNSFKKIKLMRILGIALFLGFMLFSVSPSYATPTTEFISTTYTRISVDRVDVASVFNFTLENNYTTLKLYYAIWPTTTDSGTAIAVETTTYSNYNNATSGTLGEVQESNVVTAYDGNAKEVNIFGADKVYLRVYIYNDTVSASNLIVKTDMDLDYWPTGGRYAAAETTTTPSDSGTSYWTYLAWMVSGVIILLALLYSGNWLGKRVTLRGPKRDTLMYQDGHKKWAVRNPDGSFKDIQDPGRAMNRDRATPHRYQTGADRKVTKK